MSTCYYCNKSFGSAEQQLELNGRLFHVATNCFSKFFKKQEHRVVSPLPTEEQEEATPED